MKSQKKDKSKRKECVISIAPKDECYFLWTNKKGFDPQGPVSCHGQCYADKKDTVKKKKSHNSIPAMYLLI